MLVHLSVPNAESGLGNKLPELVRHRIDAVHAVVDDIHLTATLQFPHDHLAKKVIALFAHERADWHAVSRRRVDHADVANPSEREVKRAWNRGSAHRQN